MVLLLLMADTIVVIMLTDILVSIWSYYLLLVVDSIVDIMLTDVLV